MKGISTKRLVLTALFAAATTVATYLIRFPFAHGFLNFGEIVIYTAALTLGPFVGGLAGGLGAAVADLFAGYLIPWAPITFVVKGLEGYLVGKLGCGGSVQRRVIAILIGGLVILVGYPVATGLLYDWPAALLEVYMDIAQVICGGIVALPLSITLRKIIQNEGFNE